MVLECRTRLSEYESGWLAGWLAAVLAPSLDLVLSEVRIYWQRANIQPQLPLAVN